jgi:ABC-type branched-subunit amino acid transport system substrate-binding protein
MRSCAAPSNDTTVTCSRPVEQYEGQESHPLIFCTGPVPAQQIEPFFPWLMRETGTRRFYLPSADYIWPHTLNKLVHEVVGAEGGEVVGEEYFPMDHMDYGRVVDDIISSGAEMVPGQHHVRMNMYIARSEGGTFNVVKHLGHIDPKEREVGNA